MVKSLESLDQTVPPKPVAAFLPAPETSGRAPEDGAADFGEKILNRSDALARYRRLRKINVDHGNEVLRRIPQKALLYWGKRIGLVRRKTFVVDGLEEMSLAFDLAVYCSWRGKTPPVERYRAIARFAAGSDEAVMLEAMCRSRFSLLAVKRHHAAAGLIFEDLFQQQEIWLMDEGLEASATQDMTFASRVVKPDLFHMSTGAMVPVDRAAMELVVADLAHRGGEVFLGEGGDVSFVEALYGAAVTLGLMDTLELR